MLGVRYLSRAGYDPNAMTSFFYKLKAHSKLEANMRDRKDQSKFINIMATHPLTSKRIAKAEKLVAQIRVNEKKHGKEEYENEINGLVFGDDPKQGIRRNQIFEHPILGIRFEVPPDFSMTNSPNKVTARSADGSIIIFDMAPLKKVHELGGMTNYLKALDINRRKFQKITKLNINGMSAVTGFAKFRKKGIQRDARLLVIEKKKNQFFRLLFEANTANTEFMSLNFKRTIFSFKRLSQSEIVAIRPLRINFKTVLKGDNVKTLAQHMPIKRFALEWFELLNKVRRDTPLESGTRVRVIE